MASRRMFSKRLINSARFLKMPISCQALYFHLGLNADDDGIVEAYNVIKTIGCTEDDLKVLVAKGFVVNSAEVVVVAVELLKLRQGQFAQGDVILHFDHHAIADEGKFTEKSSSSTVLER